MRKSLKNPLPATDKARGPALTPQLLRRSLARNLVGLGLGAPLALLIPMCQPETANVAHAYIPVTPTLALVHSPPLTAFPSDTAIIQFVQRGLGCVLTLEPLGMERVLSQCYTRYFTANGAGQFQTALMKARIPGAIMSGSETLALRIDAANIHKKAVIGTTIGPLGCVDLRIKGALVWRTRADQPVDLSVQVFRKATFDSDESLAIRTVQFLLPGGRSTVEPCG